MNTKNFTFCPWVSSSDDSLASLDERPETLERVGFRLNKAQICNDWFPENVEFTMDDDSGVVLSDSIPNDVLLLIVSKKLKMILEVEVSEKIEYLPIKVINHQGRAVKDEYYIANVLTAISCMDKEKSDYVTSSMDKTQVHHIKHLVLEQSIIPENTNIFRLGEELDLILVREDLAQIIKDAGCSGIAFINIDDYGEQYRPVDRLALAQKIADEG